MVLFTCCCFFDVVDVSIGGGVFSSLTAEILSKLVKHVVEDQRSPYENRWQRPEFLNQEDSGFATSIVSAADIALVIALGE